MWNLSANEDNQVTIANAGGIVPLIRVLVTGSETAKEQAAGALRILSKNSANKLTIVNAGGIRPLIHLFRLDWQ